MFKHRKIASQLGTEIVAGKYGRTNRLPSEIVLKQRFGVSRPTIARALRDLCDQGLIDRRAGSGTYIRPEKGRAASSGVNNLQIGIIVPCLRHTEIFEPITGEIASLCRGNDYGLCSGANMSTYSERHMTFAEADELCGQFIERGVIGVFFVPFEQQPDQDAANLRISERLKQAGIPMVLLDRDIADFPRRSEFDVVSVDNVAGGYMLAEHLIKLGVRRIAYVKRPRTAPTVDGRIHGAQMAILSKGLETPQPFVYSGDPADIKFVHSFALGQKLDAILCTSDHLAAEIMQALTRIGVRIPKDIRVVGFDNVRFASLLSIPLTTVEQPIRDIATTAFSALLERVANPSLPPRTLVLAPRLVVRESCGAYLHQKRNNTTDRAGAE